MNGSASPFMLRRRLRTELRTARLKSDLTQDQVAQAMEWSLSKMNRIEMAKSGVSANDLKALLRLYGITETERTEELLALARASRQPPWWTRYRDVAPTKLLELIDYESAASAISQFEPTLVPGILQTEEYAAEVLQAFHDETSGADRVAALVDLRTRRRELLTGENAPKFSFVMDESVIHRLVGSAAIMSKQLLHLISVADLPNVTVQIVPFTAGLYPGTKGPFKVVQFADAPDEDIVFLESSLGDVISDDQNQAKSYLEAFERITARALKPLGSVRLLGTAAGEMR